MSDFQAYERLETAGQDFGYVRITNEFHAARLRAACERRRQNAPLFTQVWQISRAAVAVVFRAGGSSGSAALRAVAFTFSGSFSHAGNGALVNRRALNGPAFRMPMPFALR